MLFKAVFGGGASSAVEVSVDTEGFENSSATNLQVLAEDSDRKLTFAANPGHVTATGTTTTAVDSLLSGLGTLGAFTGSLEGPTLQLTPPSGAVGRAQWDHPAQFPLGLGAGVDGLYGARLTLLGDLSDIGVVVFGIVDNDAEEFAAGLGVNPAGGFVPFDSGAFIPGQAGKAIVYNEAPVTTTSFTLELDDPIFLGVEQPDRYGIVVALAGGVEVPFHIEWLYGSWVGMRQMEVNRVGYGLRLDENRRLQQPRPWRLHPAATAGGHDGAIGGDALEEVVGWRSDVRRIIAPKLTHPSDYTWVADRVVALKSQPTAAHNGFWEILAVGSGHGNAPTSAEVGGEPDGTIVAVRCTELNGRWEEVDLLGGSVVVVAGQFLWITTGDGLSCDFANPYQSAEQRVVPLVDRIGVTSGESYDSFDWYAKHNFSGELGELIVPTGTYDEDTFYAAFPYEHDIEDGVLCGFKVHFAPGNTLLDLGAYDSYVMVESLTDSATPEWKWEFGWALDAGLNILIPGGDLDAQNSDFQRVYAVGQMVDDDDVYLLFGDPKRKNWSGRIVFMYVSFAWSGTTSEDKSVSVEITPIYDESLGRDTVLEIEDANYYVMPYTPKTIVYTGSASDPTVTTHSSETDRTNSNYWDNSKDLVIKRLTTESGGSSVLVNADAGVILSNPGDRVTLRSLPEGLGSWIQID